jgi:hypothetical protein
MNEVDISSQLGSYLKFRDKDNSIEIQSIATRLINHGLIDERKSRLLRGLRKYKLSSLGIFYVLSETTSYSPVFLKKYSKDAILQSILYSYFEEDTISSVTGRLYSILTDYLRQSCKRTAAILEDIRSSNKTDYKDEMAKNLELELQWNAKSLAFKITIMYTESNIHASNPKSDGGDASVTYYELEHRMKEILSNDKLEKNSTKGLGKLVKLANETSYCVNFGLDASVSVISIDWPSLIIPRANLSPTVLFEMT